MNKVFFLLILFSSMMIKAQNLKADFKKVETLQDAKAFRLNNKKCKCKIYTYNVEKHRTPFADQFFNAKQGKTITIKDKNDNKSLYKVVEKDAEIHFRFRYIFFNGNEIDQQIIDAKQEAIINAVNSKANFKKLIISEAMQNKHIRSGDFDWTSKSDLDDELINAIASHDLNDVFKVYIPSTNKYYVIKKTYEPKEIELVHVLKMNI